MSIPWRDHCRAAFDWWVYWSARRAALLAMFVWAAAEATVWPILPDFALLPLAVGNHRRYHAPLVAAILGMALGGAALYLFAFWFPGQALHLLADLPTVQPSKVAGASAHLKAHGWAAFLYQPWSGIPFKVWAIVAGTQGIQPLLAIPTFILARSLRMAIVARLASYIAGRFTATVRDLFLYIVAAYLVLFFSVWWQLVR